MLVGIFLNVIRLSNLYFKFDQFQPEVAQLAAFMIRTPVHSYLEEILVLYFSEGLNV